MERTPAAVAEEAIRRVGARVTVPRVQVLALLLKEPQALTHLQIERRLHRAYGIDRVTIYRVLEWLVRNGLAHRIAMGDRAWRFDAIDPDHAHRHAHFQCGRCGTVTCLEGFAETPKVRLPQGYRSNEVELTVKGVCAECGPRAVGPAKPGRAAQAH